MRKGTGPSLSEYKSDCNKVAEAIEGLANKRELLAILATGVRFLAAVKQGEMHSIGSTSSSDGRW